MTAETTQVFQAKVMGCCSTTINNEEAMGDVIDHNDKTKSPTTDTKIVTNAEIDSNQTDDTTNTTNIDQEMDREEFHQSELDENNMAIKEQQKKQMQLQMTIEILENKNRKDKEKEKDQNKNTPKKYTYTPTNNSNLNTPMVMNQNGTVHTNGFQSSLDFNGTPMRELEQTMFGLLDQMNDETQQ